MKTCDEVHPECDIYHPEGHKSIMETCKKCGKSADMSIAEPKEDAEVFGLCYTCIQVWANINYFNKKNNIFEWLTYDLRQV